MRRFCPKHQCNLVPKSGPYGPFFGCPYYKVSGCCYTENNSWTFVEFKFVPIKKEVIDLTDEPTVEEEKEPPPPPKRRRSSRARKERTDLADFLL